MPITIFFFAKFKTSFVDLGGSEPLYSLENPLDRDSYVARKPTIKCFPRMRFHEPWVTNVVLFCSLYPMTNLIVIVSRLFHKISAISARNATHIPAPRTTYTPSMLIKSMRFRDNAVQRKRKDIPWEPNNVPYIVYLILFHMGVTYLWEVKISSISFRIRRQRSAWDNF